MDSMLQYKEKYPILCNLLGDKYINAPMNSKDSGSLKSLLINDDIFLAQLNEILEKLSNKTTFPEGNLKSIIKHLKSPGVQFFNTLSEICLMNYFLKEKHLNGYEIPFAVNDKIGDFDLQIEYKGNEYFIDVLNIELVEDDRMKDFVFPLTGCIKEDLDNIIERKIVKKANTMLDADLWIEYSYTNNGRTITKNQNNLFYQSQTKDAFGNLVSVIDNDNNKTEYFYDAKNQLIAVLDSNKIVKYFVYNAFGKLAFAWYIDAYGEKIDSHNIEKVYETLQKDKASIRYIYSLTGDLIFVSDGKSILQEAP